MNKSILFFLLFCAPAAAQFGGSNAKKLQGTEVCAGINPSDTQVLTWSASSGCWGAGNGGGGGSSPVSCSGGVCTLPGGDTFSLTSLTVSGTLSVGTTVLGMGQGLDADITSGAKVGGGVATDNTALINGLLASGSDTQPVSIFLTGATVTGGVLLPSFGNVHIQGRGFRDGFFTKSGANAFGITNATSAGSPWTPFDPELYAGYGLTGFTAPAITNVGSVILEDFSLNGNAGTQGGCVGVVDCTLSSSFANSEKGYETLGPPATVNYGSGALPGTPTAGQYAKITNGSSNVDCTTRAGAFVVFCIYAPSVGGWTPALSGVENQWYTGIDLSNLQYVKLSNLHIWNAPTYGIRLMNVARVLIENPVIENVYGNDNHDAIHIDGPADSVTIRGGTFTNIDDDAIAFNAQEGYSGTISNVLVDGATFINCAYGPNLYGAANELVTNVKGNFYSGLSRLITGGNLTISNSISTRNAAGGAFLQTIGTFGLLTLNEDESIDGFSGGNVDLLMNPGAVTTGPILVRNFKRSMLGTGTVAPAFIGIYSGTIAKLTINGFEMVNSPTNSYTMPYLILMGGGSLTELVVNAMNPTGITAAVSTWTGIARVSGAGLMSWGFEVPDAIVVNGVAYLSATSHKPSIKLGGTPNGIDGTVETFTIAP